MKKLAISLLLFGAGTTAHAQTSAGTVLLGGGIGYSRSDEDATATTYTTKQSRQEFSFTPTAGYFVRDNLAVGLTSGLFRGKQKGSGTSSFPIPNSDHQFTNKYSSAAIGPFVRYYKMLGEKVASYGQLSGSYQKGNSSTTNTSPYFQENDTKYKGFNAVLTPGFTYFPTNKLGLELTFGNLSYQNSEFRIHYRGRSAAQLAQNNAIKLRRFVWLAESCSRRFFLLGRAVTGRFTT